jgi:hypothetical protein
VLRNSSEQVLAVAHAEQDDREQGPAFLAGESYRVVARNVEKFDRGQRYGVGLPGEIEVARERAEPRVAVHVGVEGNRLLIKQQSGQICALPSGTDLYRVSLLLKRKFHATALLATIREARLL